MYICLSNVLITYFNKLCFLYISSTLVENKTISSNHEFKVTLIFCDHLPYSYYNIKMIIHEDRI